MTQLVDDLLFLARADGWHTRGRNEIVHLDELILDVAERFAPLAQQRRLQIQVVRCPTWWFSVIASIWRGCSAIWLRTR